MKPNLLFLLLGLLWSIPSFGQSREYLNKRLADVNRLPDGQDKITALVDVAYIYQGIDPDSGQFYIYKVLDLSKKLNDGWGKASYYYWMAALYSKKGRYKEANAWIDTGLVYSQEIKSNTMIAGGYQTRALNLASADEVPEALASIDKAWEYAQKTSKGQTKTKILLDRGRILQMTGSVQESIPEYVEAIRLADSLNRPDLQLSAYANIALEYQILDDGEKLKQYADKAVGLADKVGIERFSLQAKTIKAISLTRESDLQQAEKTALEALELAKKLSEPEYTEANYLTLSTICRKAKKYDDALKYLNAIPFSNANKFKYLTNLADIYAAIDDSAKVVNTYQQAIDYRKPGLAYEIKDSYKGLATYFKNKGQYPKAVEYLEKAVDLPGGSDVFAKMRSALGREIDWRAEVEKKVKERQVLQLEQAKLKLQQDSILSDLKLTRQEKEILLRKNEAAQRESTLRLLEKERELQSCEIDNKEGLLKSEHLEREQADNKVALLNRESELTAAKLKFEQLLRGVLLTLLALVIGGGYLFARYRQRMNLERVRQNIAKDLHDEVGSVIGSIALFSRGLQNTIGDSRPDAVDGLKRNEQNATTSLDALRDVVWAIDARSDNTDDLMVHLREFVLPLAEAAGIACSFSPNPSPAIHLTPQVKKNLWLILKEAVTNAIRYAQTDRVECNLTAQGKYIHCTVKDSGIGFNPGNTRPGGNGIRNMNNRAKELGGELTINSAPGQGTRVELRFQT